MKETLVQKLSHLAESDSYPFHMPGHKRNLKDGVWERISRMDITEIEGFDNLHHAEGIIKEEQEFASRLYGSRETFYLVNGSSCGVMASICATAGDAAPLLMARSSHKSAYHAVYLQRLLPWFLYPQQSGAALPSGGITPESVAEGLDESGAKAVFITSPTYEGIISDIDAIARIVHERDAVLIVDEAHGAHLHFHGAFGKSAVAAGADLVIQSLHKTMPAMTQSAFLHVCSDRISLEKLRMYMGMFQTSSPSYVMMASISHCLHMVSGNETLYFAPYVERLEKFYQRTSALRHLKVLDGNWCREAYGLKKDPSKIVIYAHNLTDKNGRRFAGRELMETLRLQYHLELEMASKEYVLAMTSFMDTQEGFDRLCEALFAIDEELFAAPGENLTSAVPIYSMSGLHASACHVQDGHKGGETAYAPVMAAKQGVCSIYEAVNGDSEIVDFQDAAKRVSCEYLYLYPPGIPVVAPGEILTADVLEYLHQCHRAGLLVQGTADYSLRTIRVMRKNFFIANNMVK